MRSFKRIAAIVIIRFHARSGGSAKDRFRRFKLSFTPNTSAMATDTVQNGFARSRVRVSLGFGHIEFDVPQGPVGRCEGCTQGDARCGSLNHYAERLIVAD